MNNFDYHVTTDIRFGHNQIQCLPEELAKFGKKVLLVYGGGSIKRNGIYDTLKSLLKDFEVFELPGIEPNPRVTSVDKGARICKEEGIDVILSVGGGSCIDASKNIACAAYYDGPAWDLVLNNSLVTKALPIVTILTICATGSEMNCGAVISNLETKEKLELYHESLYPVLSICDPTYLYTLPEKQTAAGTADIISHVFEQYFQKNDCAYITDRLSESVLKTCFTYGPIALENPKDYEARSNLMWASTVALNNLLSLGKGGAWTVHGIEHVLSAFYDITHGEGLAILTPAWMTYVLCETTVDRFTMYAKNVWDIEENDLYSAARKGICQTKAFFWEMGLPTSLSEVGISSEQFEEMAKEAVRTSSIDTDDVYFRLSERDVVKIFQLCE